MASNDENPSGTPEPRLPPKPEKPVPGECCERGCVNCVWVYYELALDRWKARCEAILAGVDDADAPSSDAAAS